MRQRQFAILRSHPGSCSDPLQPHQQFPGLARIGLDNLATVGLFHIFLTIGNFDFQVLLPHCGVGPQQQFPGPVRSPEYSNHRGLDTLTDCSTGRDWYNFYPQFFGVGSHWTLTGLYLLGVIFSLLEWTLWLLPFSTLLPALWNISHWTLLHSGQIVLRFLRWPDFRSAHWLWRVRNCQLLFGENLHLPPLLLALLAPKLDGFTNSFQFNTLLNFSQFNLRCGLRQQQFFPQLGRRSGPKSRRGVWCRSLILTCVFTMLATHCRGEGWAPSMGGPEVSSLGLSHQLGETKPHGMQPPVCSAHQTGLEPPGMRRIRLRNAAFAELASEQLLLEWRGTEDNITAKQILHEWDSI